MLDEENRHPRLLELAQECGERADFLGDETCGRLVEKQDARPNRQSARDLDQPAMPIGEIVGGDLLQLRNSDEAQQTARFAPLVVGLDTIAARTDRGVPQAHARLPRDADQHVLDHGHVAKHFHCLEGADDAAARCGMQRTGLCFCSVYDNSARVGAVRAGNDVDQRRLAGAVRADQGMDRSAGNAEAHIRQCYEAAKRPRQVFDLQFGAGGPWQCHECLDQRRLPIVPLPLGSRLVRQEAHDAAGKEVKSQ